MSNKFRIILVMQLLITFLLFSNSAPSIVTAEGNGCGIGDVLEIGTHDDFGPYGFQPPNSDTHIGFEVNIANELKTRLGDVAADISYVERTEHINALKNCDIDVLIATISPSWSDESDFDFSQSYLSVSFGFMMLEANKEDFQTIGTLLGKRVGVIDGTQESEWLSKEVGESYIVAPFNTYRQALEALIDAEIVGLVADERALLHTIKSPEIYDIGEELDLANHLLPASSPTINYAIAVRQGDTVLRELVDVALQAIKEEKTEWFDDTPFQVHIAPGNKEVNASDIARLTAKLAELPNSAEVTESPDSVVEQLKKGETLTIGVSNPLGYEIGEPLGFDADIAREFVYRWAGIDALSILVPITPTLGLERLAAGELDLLVASTVPTWERAKDPNITFSQIYAEDTVSVLIRDDMEIEDLDVGRIGVLEGGAGEEWVRATYGITNSIPITNFQTIEAEKKLDNGEIDAIVGGEKTLSFMSEKQDILLKDGYTVPYAIAMPEHDNKLRDLVNVTLQDMKGAQDEDSFYDCLHQKWFPSDRPLYEIEQVSQNWSTEDEVYPETNYRRLEGNCLPKPALDNILSRNPPTLRVAVLDDFAPMGFRTDTGGFTGFDIDLVDAIVDFWRENIPELSDLQIEWKVKDTKLRIPSLVTGEVDLIAAALTHNHEREADIDFSQHYLLTHQQLLVHKNSGITKALDLADKTVAVINGSTSQLNLKAFAENKNITINEFGVNEHGSAVNALLDDDEIVAFTSDAIALQVLEDANPNLEIVGEFLSDEPYALGMRSGNSEFRDLINYTLQQLKKPENGAYDTIYKRWIKNSDPYPVEILPTVNETAKEISKPSPVIFNPDLSVIERLRREKKPVLVVGVMDDFPPFSSLKDDGSCCIGFDIDLVREFAKRWLGEDTLFQRTEDLPFSVILKPIPAADRELVVESGQVDFVVAAMTRTWEREKRIDFSQTYFIDTPSLLVHKDSNIFGLEDLQGQDVIAVAGTTCHDYLKEHEDELDIKTVIPYDGHSSAVDAVDNKSVAAYCTDRVALKFLSLPYPDLIVRGTIPTQEPYGIAVREGDHQLRDLINSTLQEMVLDGTYARLYERHLLEWLQGNDEELSDDLRRNALEEAKSQITLWPRRTYVGNLGYSLTPMVYVPSGMFTRGYDGAEWATVAEGPPRQIQVDEFYIDQFEVTARRYRECVNAGDCRLPDEKIQVGVSIDYYDDPKLYGNYPVVYVNWHHAVAYCDSQGKNLPTEAQWEKAVRGPNNSLYPEGVLAPESVLDPEGLTRAMQLFDPDDSGEQYRKLGLKFRHARPIGSNPFDFSGYFVYDMASNVHELVHDRHDGSTELSESYYRIGTDDNPDGQSTGIYRIVRGGSWEDGSVRWVEDELISWRSSVRSVLQTHAEDEPNIQNEPPSSGHDIGFRCVSKVPPLQLSPIE